MKAVSPVRAARSCLRAACCVSSRSLGVSRSELCHMDDLYSRLKALVPSIPQNKTVSQMEILQHVIDYICDLQIALKAAELTHTFPTDDEPLCH